MPDRKRIRDRKPPTTLSKEQYDEQWMCIDESVETAAVLTQDEVCVDILTDKEKDGSDTGINWSFSDQGTTFNPETNNAKQFFFNEFSRNFV